MLATEQPNFLFLFPDSHRGDWLPYDAATREMLGMSEIGLRMPNVQHLMEEGSTFSRAVTPAPLCAPARACLASGVRYVHCGTPSNQANFPPDRRTFYSVLKETGYKVGGVGKLDLHKPAHWWGLDGWIDELGALGFTDAVDNAGKIDAIVSGKETPKDPYMRYLHQRNLAELHVRDMTGRKGHGTEPTELPEEAYCDNWLTDNGIRMLRDFPQDQPWLLMVNFTGPHGPWDVTKSMREAWQDAELPGPSDGDPQKAQQVLDVRRNYAAMLENIDRNIGLLLAEVAGRGELDRTIVIYSSDHGEMLGDRRSFGKCSPYRGSVQVPLVIKGPGIRRGIVSDALVELQDLAATMVEYAGARLEALPEAAGESRSLKPVLEGRTTTHRQVQLSALDADGKHIGNGWSMLANGRHKLVLWEGREPELYDLAADPWEVDNIAAEHAEIVQSLRAQGQARN